MANDELVISVPTNGHIAGPWWGKIVMLLVKQQENASAIATIFLP
jgi:hypothetical protein